jgi:hypothetical protein
MAPCGRTVWWCQRCEHSAPWWWWGRYKIQTRPLHFIDGNLNAERYRDRSLRPIVVQFILRHHLMLQHYYAQLHAARICTQFLEAENVFHGLHTHQTCHHLSMCGILWIDRIFQFTPISSNFAQPLKSRTTFHKSTAWSTLGEGDVSPCMRQMAVIPDTDWFSDPRPYLFLKVSITDACLYSQSSEIHRLGPNECIYIYS